MRGVRAKRSVPLLTAIVCVQVDRLRANVGSIDGHGGQDQVGADIRMHMYGHRGAERLEGRAKAG